MTPIRLSTNKHNLNFLVRKLGLNPILVNLKVETLAGRLWQGAMYDLPHGHFVVDHIIEMKVIFSALR